MKSERKDEEEAIFGVISSDGRQIRMLQLITQQRRQKVIRRHMAADNGHQVIICQQDQFSPTLKRLHLQIALANK